VVIGGGRRHQPVERADPGTGVVRLRYATLRDYSGRGVITTATYEARALGLHSAMGLMKAATRVVAQRCVAALDRSRPGVGTLDGLVPAAAADYHGLSAQLRMAQQLD
jgi:nucleotidyltransferase/DNA polymerase involved in DNA repair